MGDAQPTPTLEEQAPWTSQVQKELRGDDLLALGANLNDVVKNARALRTERDDLKKKVGPKPGVPDTPDGYKFTFPDEAKDLVKPEDVKAFSALAKELTLNNDEAGKLVAFETARTVAARKAYADLQKANAKKVRDDLQTEYKDKAEERLAGAFALVEQLGGKELKDELNVTGMGNNPLLIKMLVKVGSYFSEKGLTLPSAGGGSAGADEGPDLNEVYKRSIATGAMQKV